MTIVRLGQASFPSGRAALVDASLLGGELANDWEAWAAVADGMPAGAHPVHAEPDATGAHPDRWTNVWVELGAGAVADADFVGVIPVESGRLLFIDASAVAKWNVETSRDGNADFVCRGKDAVSLAKLLDAPALPGGGFGFVDRPIDEIAAIARESTGLLAGRGWSVTTTTHPHTDLHMLVRAAAASPTASSELELAGATSCFFVSPWGAGVHKVMLDRDASGRPLRLRVELVPLDDVEDDAPEL